MTLIQKTKQREKGEGVTIGTVPRMTRFSPLTVTIHREATDSLFIVIRK